MVRVGARHVGGFYDPAGDDVWQIHPACPSAGLPDYWCCPVCETSKKSGFMVIDEGIDQFVQRSDVYSHPLRIIWQEAPIGRLLQGATRYA